MNKQCVFALAVFATPTLPTPLRPIAHLQMYRQNWTAELARLELMTQNLRARLSLDRRRPSRERQRMARPESSHSLAFCEPGVGATGVADSLGLEAVQNLERQLHGIRDTLATHSANSQSSQVLLFSCLITTLGTGS